MIVQFIWWMERWYYDDDRIDRIEFMATVRRRAYQWTVHERYRDNWTEPNYTYLSIFTQKDKKLTITNLFIYSELQWLHLQTHNS